jgi:hypothetical protein
MNENEKIDLGSRNGQRALDEYYGKGAPTFFSIFTS